MVWVTRWRLSNRRRVRDLRQIHTLGFETGTALYRGQILTPGAQGLRYALSHRVQVLTGFTALFGIERAKCPLELAEFGLLAEQLGFDRLQFLNCPRRFDQGERCGTGCADVVAQSHSHEARARPGNTAANKSVRTRLVREIPLPRTRGCWPRH